MKVIAINGSPKANGNTAYAISLVLEELAAWDAAVAAGTAVAFLTIKQTNGRIKWPRQTAL